MSKTETVGEKFGSGFWHLLNPVEMPDGLFAAIVIGCLILAGLSLSYLVAQHEKADDAAFVAKAQGLGFKKLDASEPSGDQ